MATATSGPGDRIAAAPRTERRLSTETKSATKTTEFYAYVAATVGVLLAGLLTKVGDGHDDRLTAQDTWLIVGILTVLVAALMLEVISTAAEAAAARGGDIEIADALKVCVAAAQFTPSEATKPGSDVQSDAYALLSTK